MKWHAQLALVLALVCLVAGSCSGMSDDCSANPVPLRRFNELNFHPDTCNLKWKHGCTALDKHGELQQKPPPFSLCNAWRQPAGLLAIDAYTLSLQHNDFAPESAAVTLHGLWPGSAGGTGAKNQPYGCLNGEEFDETMLTTFGGLLSHFWPTNARFNNTMECFILSEWMKHGTCAVIPGADGTAFRIPQEAFFRTAFVMANEFNANAALREQLQQQPMEPLISTRCVQCAYLATVGWTGTDVGSVPRMSDDCIDQCFACGNHWDKCPPAQLDSTVELDPSNAPRKTSDRSSLGNGNASFPVLEFAMPALMSSSNPLTCSAHGSDSCSPENDFCGAGSCDPAESAQASAALPSPPSYNNKHATRADGHNWCTPQDSSCWPTETDVHKLEQALDPTVSRLGVQWSSYPQPQPAPVPMDSINNQAFYGLGNAPGGLRALYYYEDVAEMQRPCFVPPAPADTVTAWNSASDMCKAALHQNQYRNWNPFIVVFPLNERHVAAALTFAARHRLCIATAGTGHEYNSRNSCPTGGILIRTILLKDKAFVPTWGEDPALAPAGAFRFGAGSIFAEMHAFSAEHARVIASGWCSTVGMVGFHLGGGHGPFAPSMGLGVDNVLEIEVLQVDRDDDAHGHGQPVVRKKIASRRHNPELFWAMRGGGGGVWGVILAMTIRAHAVPDGGLSHVVMSQTGTFCPDARPFGYQWLRDMWARFTAWQLRLNHKVSTQPGFFINTTQYNTGGLCAVTWTFNFEYFYTGGQAEQDYTLFRDGLKDVLQTDAVQEDNFQSVYEYILSMPADKFPLAVTNPLPASHPPSDAATGSQNSVFVSRQAMETAFASTMMDVLDICVESLENPDPTSPDPAQHRCGFHYLYTSLTGNLGSSQPGDTAISPGFRSALMLWNARTLTTKQANETVYRLGPNSYFSESSYVLHDWTARYWGHKAYEQLLAVKKAHDPGNHFWCHHCVGDNPDDAYGEPLGAAADIVEKDEL